MGKNINTFSENMRRTLVGQANNLAYLTALQRSMTTNDTFVEYDYENADGDTRTYQMPSYTAVINRLEALEESMQNLSKGKGSINLKDGTRRAITLSNAPLAPSKITGVEDPSTFALDTNWFFEDIMFPGATVKVDLTGKIEDSSDRVKVARIILDSTDTATQQLWANNLSNSYYDYVSLKSMLAYNGVQYSEDIETVDLPLVSNTCSGEFQVTTDPEIIDGNTWYKLDVIYYHTVNEDGEFSGENNILSVGDRLLYDNTIFEVTGIDQNTAKIRIKVVSGSSIPGIYSVFRYYQDPFREKSLNVRFGANEYDIMYFKGVNEQYNLLADQWSDPVKFDTNELLLEGEPNTRFIDFYRSSVVDWGANMIAEAKEKSIKAYYGQKPNAPTLVADELRVVQINTQINAAIDNAEIKNTASEIETTKSQIASLKATIAAQKTQLQSITDADTYNSMQQQIAINTTDLQNLQTSYTSLVNTLKSIVKDNQAVNVDPKYHIRGFFAVPETKYRDEAMTIPEEIVGFDIAYRYICEDNTAVQLNTFTYSDTGAKVTGTFSDWTIGRSPMKTREYDNQTGLYRWKAENVADGTEVNINQIDIPITKGEKVEIKVRSVSEAGYPENPLLSDWSNSIIMEFPSTLPTTNDVADLVKEINDDALELTINNTMESLGVISHLDDTVANTTSVSGVYFKHEAKNIAYEDDKGGTIESVSLQKKIDDMQKRIDELEEIIRNLGK